MPYFYFRHFPSSAMLYAEMPMEKSQDNRVIDVLHPSLTMTSSSSSEERKGSSLSSTEPSNNEMMSSCEAKYENLPYHLKSCLDFISVYVSNNYGFPIEKDELVRLLLAEGLIPSRTGEIIEDVARSIISELIGLGMLQQHDSLKLTSSRGFERLEVAKELCLIEVDKQTFISKASNLPVHAFFHLASDLDFIKSLQIRSLFLFYVCKRISFVSMQAICQLKFLVVLDIQGLVGCLPEEVGTLVHLTYLSVVNTDLDKLPPTLGNLQKLQTLKIKPWLRLRELPKEVLKIQQLRHLLISSEVRVPKGIGQLVNLQTCEGVFAGDVANELGFLTQLRKLVLERVSEDHASELAAAIMKMENLVSLSLQADKSHVDGTFLNLLPELEPFSPSYLLQELHLNGDLVELPNWLPSMESLTSLRLEESSLSEDKVSVLQYLSKLKYLTLWHACNSKVISKVFCGAGGFPKLEFLSVNSNFLVEWTEIVRGAFPSLRYLNFGYCSNLRFIPEGLQNISTLQELHMWAHEDLSRRLRDEEKYKIEHISKVWFKGKPI